MTVTATVLPDGSVSVQDGNMTWQPLSPEAVQAVAAQASASAAAGNKALITDGLTVLAGIFAVAGPAATATVSVTSSAVTAAVDAASFRLIQERLPGAFDGSGAWVSGPFVVTTTPPPALTTPTAP